MSKAVHTFRSRTGSKGGEIQVRMVWVCCQMRRERLQSVTCVSLHMQSATFLIQYYDSSVSAFKPFCLAPITKSNVGEGRWKICNSSD